MPLFRRVTNSTRFSSAPNLIGTDIEIRYEDGNEELAAYLPVQGEVIQSFEIADTPGGWHLVWLDEAFEYGGEPQAHLMIAARWVARPIGSSEAVPVNIRFVPDVALIQKGAPDIEKLPFAAKGSAAAL